MSLQRRSAIRGLGAVAAASLVLGGLAGCANADDLDGDPSAERFTIGLLLPNVSVPRFEDQDKPYFEEKVEELCAECEVLYANAQSDDPAKQQEQADSMLTQGVDVLVLDAADVVAGAAIVERAASQGVPVVAYDRLVDNDKVSYAITNDYFAVGQFQAQSLVDKLEADDITPEDGGIVMLNGSEVDNNAATIKEGALSVLEDSGFAILSQVATWDPTEAQNFVAGQITQHGDDIVAVYSANDGNAGGAIAAFKAGGIVPPPMTGLDATLAGIQQILVGDLYMSVYMSIKDEAYEAAEVALELARGEKVDGPTDLDGIPATLLEPASVTVETIGDTVITDGFYTREEICTSEYEAQCKAAGL